MCGHMQPVRDECDGAEQKAAHISSTIMAAQIEMTHQVRFSARSWSSPKKTMGVRFHRQPHFR
jgi:hypothetical protein